METEEFYSTLFHEMIQSTGHSSRLNRIHPQKKRDERKDYAREELVAEIGPSFLINKSCKVLASVNINGTATIKIKETIILFKTLPIPDFESENIFSDTA